MQQIFIIIPLGFGVFYFLKPQCFRSWFYFHLQVTLGGHKPALLDPSRGRLNLLQGSFSVKVFSVVEKLAHEIVKKNM
jgi:hypothetical protein